MKRRFAIAAICVCAALILVSTAQTLAQETKSPAKYTGTIMVLNKEAKTFTIQQVSSTTSIQMKYTDKTVFTYRNKPSTIDELKEGRRVTVVTDPEQTKEIVALRIDFR